MTESQAAPTASPAAFAGTPIRDLIAGGVAFGVVVLGANVLAHTLKGVMDESVRTGAVGMLFASVPGVYSITRKLTAGIGPKPAKPAPELAPWYITGMFAGACLFAWTQFFGFLIGAAAGIAGVVGGQTVEHEMLRTAGVLLSVLQLPLLIVWSVVVGHYVYKHTRQFVILAAILAIMIVIGLNLFINLVVLPEATAKMLSAMGAAANAWTDYLPGLAAVAAAMIIGILIGAAAGAIARVRFNARLASLAAKLDKDGRLELLDEARARVLERAS